MNLSMLNKSSKFYIILDNVKKINLFKDILTSKDTSKYSILNLVNLAKIEYLFLMVIKLEILKNLKNLLNNLKLLIYLKKNMRFS